MPPHRPQAHTESAATPPPWMKFAFGFMCALFALVAIFGWQQWEDARRDYASKVHELKIKSERNAKALKDKEELEEWLFKFQRDDEFRRNIARQRLQYVAPGEVILRMEPVGAGRR